MSEQDIARYKHIFDEILRMTDDGFIVVDTNGTVWATARRPIPHQRHRDGHQRPVL